MSSVIIAGDTSGSVTLSAPAVSGTTTLTLPATSGTVLTSANISSNLPTGSVLQVQTSTFDGYISTAVTGVAPTTITSGYQIFSLSFTPISATSTILVQTSTVSICEASNVSDILWISLWDGSTFIAANSGTALYTSFTGGLNAGYYTLNNSYTSGSTSARTIQVRAGANQAVTIQINGNSSAAYTGSSARIQMTVWEIAA